MRMHCRGAISTHFSAPQFSEDIHPTDETHYQVSLLVLLLPAAGAARVPGCKAARLPGTVASGPQLHE